jgi:hypothetical protein
MDFIGANSGYWKFSEVNSDKSTTESHEWGHSNGEDHPGNCNWIGLGIPRIMLPRGSWVDPQYQWDPKAKPGKAGGTIDPKYREVTQDDIEDLLLDQLHFDKNGKASIGDQSNIYHEK